MLKAWRGQIAWHDVVGTRKMVENDDQRGDTAKGINFFEPAGRFRCDFLVGRTIPRALLTHQLLQLRPRCPDRAEKSDGINPSAH